MTDPIHIPAIHVSPSGNLKSITHNDERRTLHETAFPFKVYIDVETVRGDMTGEEFVAWLRDNIQYPYSYGGDHILFQTEADAMLFKLRF